MNRNILETIIGALVLVVAGGFLAFAYKGAGAGTTRDGYELVARFDHADGVNVGSDVRISGVKIGTVVQQVLDPTTYLAELHLRIENNIKLPKDSSAEIVSSSLLGGKYIALSPGAEEALLAEGDQIQYTQSSVNLEALLGKFIFGAADGKDGKKEDDGEKVDSKGAF